MQASQGWRFQLGKGIDRAYHTGFKDTRFIEQKKFLLNSP
jgi:hypothetical protein